MSLYVYPGKSRSLYFPESKISKRPIFPDLPCSIKRIVKIFFKAGLFLNKQTH